MFNLQYKDRLFKDIFSDKGRLLSLYNALNRSNYTNVDDLEITTIEGILYVTMKNDLSFLLDSEMHLYEQQSSYNPNMPLRGFFYFAELYQKHLSKIQKDIYGRNLVMLPTPVYIVFYNGDDKTAVPDVQKLHLSDAFIKKSDSAKSDFEWTATMLNINKGHNVELLRACTPLDCYSTYVDKVREYRKAGFSKDDSVEKAIDFAIKNDFLDGYFAQKKMEVLNMSLYEFNQDEYDRNRRNEGYAQAKAEYEAEIERLRAENVALKAR